MGDEKDWAEGQTNKKNEKKHLIICVTDPVSIKRKETGAYEDFDSGRYDLQNINNTSFSRQTCANQGLLIKNKKVHTGQDIRRQLPFAM